MIDLDPKTVLLIDEAFGSEICSDCGAPAKRMIRKNFYCHQCAQPNNSHSPTEVFIPRHQIVERLSSR